jgi:hypothetical protein
LPELTVLLDDPVDASHIVSFSGENARREQDNLYELSVERMLVKSRDRPKLDGVPVPSVESSAGTCRLVGNFATRQASGVSCAATDGQGRKYSCTASPWRADDWQKPAAAERRQGGIVFAVTVKPSLHMRAVISTQLEPQGSMQGFPVLLPNRDS